ncbi:MAG: hypothetical protein ACKVOE_03800 [Rickettsiales bacterium]
MVASADSVDFTAVIDELLRARPLAGPHASALQSQLASRARALLSAPDMRYMPVFKILELIAGMVTLAQAVDVETQLRPNEARALLREALADSTPLVHQFQLEAALERARYEPMMLTHDGSGERSQLLRQRWAAMRAAHQQHEALPPVWMAIVERAVEHAIAAPEFRHFRPRPLLQLFAEMLATARRLHELHTPVAELATALSPTGTVWKRYALKQKRYREKPARPPEFPALPTIH